MELKLRCTASGTQGHSVLRSVEPGSQLEVSIIHGEPLCTGAEYTFKLMEGPKVEEPKPLPLFAQQAADALSGEIHD